jgi:hypothetical protein
MTDQTKDAIERVRTIVVQGLRSAPNPVGTNSGWVTNPGVLADDICTLLSELDRLTKPIEDAEVAQAIDGLRSFKTSLRFDAHGSPGERVMTLEPVKFAAGIALITSLARENEQLRAERDDAMLISREQEEAVIAAGFESQALRERAEAAEARAQRYTEVLREIGKRDRIGSFSFVVGNKYVGLADFIAAALSDAEPETGAKK